MPPLLIGRGRSSSRDEPEGVDDDYQGDGGADERANYLLQDSECDSHLARLAVGPWSMNPITGPRVLPSHSLQVLQVTALGAS